ALVKHHRAVRPLVGIDPDQQRRRTSSSLAGGTPQRAILERSNARSCFEPHRSRHPAGGRFDRKPTNGGRAFWRPPTGPRDATSNTRTSASDRHSGQSGAAGRGFDNARFGAPYALVSV